MAARNREIESKWYTPRPMDEVRAMLEDTLGSARDRVVADASTDLYWALTEGRQAAQFVRLRSRAEGCILTIKGKDRGSNTNRIEIDVPVAAPLSQAQAFAEGIWGDVTGTVTKKYWVYWLKGKDEHTNISLYAVKGHPGTFIEVEASTQKVLADLEEQFLGDLIEDGLTLTQEHRSIYELFILPLKERFTL